ncbi:type I-E CRISPR-associated endonuclease Cas1e [Jatrophihabitans lederbergiae]|uniref:CRISPR-associated endonuclease Cas1 n=1 Tax=Jatrophihabitans lederbergiae TaxID=3075547 RepID=A0ABU2J6E1_9ACTN|nr:type I-E CRISPR-associated endonuclease Cas1e [Jatrophihabitans sp. DSM 44399]MDT0260059.1 type I-E CRISPR-associated endonuclease Cas1e [Jatrophihabitans sp. DSM 44399]
MKRLPGQAPASLPELIRAQDRISFLYVERCSLSREDNAITVTDARGTAHVPATAIASLLIGPGTSVTHQTMVLMADSGTVAVWVGERGVRYYAHGRSMASQTSLLDAQARLVSNRNERLDVARKMYGLRFPGEDVSRMTMQQLRGREGVRVQRLYRYHAERSGVSWGKRSYDRESWDNADPINQALSAANSCLYGATQAVIVSLGCSPGLGFVHTGHEKSLVYDIADLYKAETSIPVAFDLVAAGPDPDSLPALVRKAMRESMVEAKLMKRCITDIKFLLGVDVADDGPDVLYLWDDQEQTVAAGVVYLDPSTDYATEFKEGEKPWSS